MGNPRQSYQGLGLRCAAEAWPWRLLLSIASIEQISNSPLDKAVLLFSLSRIRPRKHTFDREQILS